MHYDLITDQDYENLPEPDDLKFVAIEAICRRNLNRFMENEGSSGFDDLLRNQYMMHVASAADTLGIPGIEYPVSARPASMLDQFMVQVTAAVTRIRLRSSVSTRGTVRIAAQTRVQLDVQIRKLREIIATGDMPEDKRRALMARLDQLADEVAKTRLNLAAAMAVIAYVSMTIASGTSFLADAPEAIATISGLIGIDQQAEEAELQRLGPPPAQKALPAPESKPEVNNVPAFEPGGMDDDIPF